MGLHWDLCSGFLDELADSLIERLAKDSAMSDILLCELVDEPESAERTATSIGLLAKRHSRAASTVSKLS